MRNGGLKKQPSCIMFNYNFHSNANAFNEETCLRKESFAGFTFRVIFTVQALGNMKLMIRNLLVVLHSVGPNKIFLELCKVISTKTAYEM